jgi:hypothetical protein
MQIIADEVVSIPADGSFASLTRANVDGGDGTSKTVVAVLYNHDRGDCAVGYRVGNNPDVAGYLYKRIDPGEVVEISGYGVLRDLRFVNLGTAAAKLYVEYFS